MEETYRNPHRFDAHEALSAINWEFCKWDRVDAVGFVICCALSAAIIGLFLLALRAAGP